MPLTKITYAQIKGATVSVLQVTSSTSSVGYNQAPSGIEGLVLVGPNSGSASVAMNFNSTSPYQNAYANFQNIAIYNFWNGLTFRDNTYLLGFSGMNIRVDGACLTNYTGLTNSGERMAFVNSTFSGAQYALICVAAQPLAAQIAILNITARHLTRI